MDGQTLIIALIASLPGFLFAVSAIAMARPNRSKILAEAEARNSDAVKNYALATTSYAIEVTKLREELKTMRSEVEERDMLIKDIRIQLENLMDWANRLVHQVKSLGKRPVPFRQTGNPMESA